MKIHTPRHTQRLHRLLNQLLIAALLLPALNVVNLQKTHAAQITERKLTLVNNAAAPTGGSQPGTASNHNFSFKVPTAGNVGSIRLTYCSVFASLGSCASDLDGITTTSATLAATPAQTGISGFTLTNTTNGQPFLTHATPQNLSANTVVTVQINNVTNRTATNSTFWVQIETYTTSAPGAIGSGVDKGIVAASTASQITVSGTMPESLVFCTGTTITGTDCNTATGTAVALGTFSPTATSSATSLMVASTNAGTGYAITYTGDTLKSGANSITQMNPATTRSLGTSQFGINVMDNATPDVGAVINPASNGTNLRAQGTAGYNTADTFKFVAVTAANSYPGATPAPETIANSGNASLGASDAQKYTISYIVNVPGSQSAGEYTTTLTYIATATF